MARGSSRAPSHQAYRGSIGRTQTRLVHVTGPRGDLVPTQVYTSIEAVSDPELVERLHAEDLTRALNVVRIEGSDPIRLAVPVVYHDPAAELLVLVLTDAHRHRELEERVTLLERLRADDSPIPQYVKDFAVAYDAAGLRAYLERRAQEALEAARSSEASRDTDRRRADVAAREGEVDRLRSELDKKARELDRKVIELELGKAEIAKGIADVERSRAEVERSRAEVERLRSEARNRVIAAVQQASESAERTTIGPPPTDRDDAATKPIPLSTIDEIETGSRVEALPPPPAATARKRPESDNFEAVATGVVDVEKVTNGASHKRGVAIEFDDEETTGASIVPQGSDPLTTQTAEAASDIVTDAWLDRASARDASTIFADASGVRIALVAGEQLARGLGGALDVRLMLHRTQLYPVITLVVGPPAAMRVTSTTQLAVVPLDIAADPHRAVLAALSRKFEITVDLIVRGHRIRRVALTAPLSENVGYILRAAEDHLRGLSGGMGAGEPSFERGRDLVIGAGFDLLGSEHPDAAEFRDDKLAQLDTAQHLRRAISMARRFARPAREDYLVCTRSFPLPRWRELRRHVLESAVAWGLWMGPELAQVAVSEGLARSRRDLVVRLDRGFETLKKHPTAFDIDADAAEDNYKAITEEARALGVELTKGKNGAIIASDDASVVSGSIGNNTPAKGVPRPRPIEELIAQLDDKQQRLAAAMELCERGDGRAAAPVISAVTKMSRAEAVRVLGMSVKFGEAAARPLTQGLQSSKGFLRHGCALALALLRTEDGTQAVIDLLLNEPTEIWREVARAIGQVGPTALMPLASNFGRLGDRVTPANTERVAWAMAHIAVRGGKAAVETMAGGQSVVAPVARHALELHASAARDQVRVRPGAGGSQQGRDVTVNRAFSRRFFEALEQGIPDAGQAGLVSLDASAPMEMLDESDLIEEDEDAEQLDEADLIQS
jgi:hypothetical protein